jgi:Protein of unknown function (DUF1622)
MPGAYPRYEERLGLGLLLGLEILVTADIFRTIAQTRGAAARERSALRMGCGRRIGQYIPWWFVTDTTM